MKLKLNIESSNAAVVGEGAEQVIAAMLDTAAQQVRDGNTSGYLRDPYSSGPSIGYWEYEPEADELDGTTSDDEDDEDDDAIDADYRLHLRQEAETARAYPARPEITVEQLAGLRAALDAESISYGEMADIDDAFEQIDPATLNDLPENAMASDKLDELEARIHNHPSMWELLTCKACSDLISRLAPYQWTGWEDETDLDNEDDRDGVQYLTIADADGEEIAIIVHRQWFDERDAPVKAGKEAMAQHIVNALNAYQVPTTTPVSKEN